MQAQNPARRAHLRRCLRRGLHGCLSALVFALVAAPAQAQHAPMPTVGVFSLLGDGLQVVAATSMPTDTRIERSARENLEVRNLGFDNIALRAARAALLRDSPQTRVEMFRSNAPLGVDEQILVAAGARRGELPAWMVQAIESKQLSHLVIVTRLRAEANIRTGDNTSIGRGTLEGVGFYMDKLYEIRNRETGAVSSGLIAPFAYLQLLLMDVRTAEVTKTYEVRDGRAFGNRDAKIGDPWTFMAPETKVRTLREMVEQGVDRGMRSLLQPP